MADELGFDGLGLNEHHQNAYGFPVAPNMIASILARRKSDAAIVVLGNTIPLYNPPLRVAEEYRADRLPEWRPAGRRLAGRLAARHGRQLRAAALAGARALLRGACLIVEAWTRQGPFPFNGRFTKLRYVNPWPKPIQKPHPPIWLAGGGSVETWKFATEQRLHLQLPEFSGHKYAKSMMDGYWD